MVTALRRRLDSDGGFTLIELLVVMIIISILMAVAVPVFLGQKQKALATQAKTNARNVQSVLESCAAGTINGALIQGTFNCGNLNTMLAEEPSLTPVLQTGQACGSTACVTVNVTGAETYNIVSRTVPSEGSMVLFNIARTASGTTRTCTSTGGSGAELLRRMCPTGQW